LARYLGLDEEKKNALEQMLKRLSSRLRDCYTTTGSPRKNEPQKLFRVQEVWPHVLEWWRKDDRRAD
jgi:hypothetical protein